MATISDIALSARPTEAETATTVQATGLTRARADASCVVAACVVGGGVALSGFPPLNNIPSLLHVTSLPGFTLLTPAVLATLLAVAFRSPGPVFKDVPRLALVAIGLLLLGGGLSLLQSPHPAESTAFLVLGLLTPAILFLVTVRSQLPATVLVGSFLTVLTAALLRADVAFLQHNGLPTPAKLFNAKFSNQAYDFHYYTLGNPDHTATFLLLPLFVSVLWAMSAQTPRRTRRWLLFASAVILFTIVLLYVRIPLIIAGVFVIGAVLRSRLPRRVRLGVAAAAFAAAAAFVVASPSHYLTDIFSTQGSSSGGVRIASVSDGLQTMTHHPLTGVGLGQFGRDSGVPAHSSIVQAGADMGLAGVAGLLLVTLGLAAACLLRVRRKAPLTVQTAALAGAGVYAAVAAVSAGATDAMFVGPISIYGLSLGLFSAVGVSTRVTAQAMTTRAACGEALATVGAWLGRGRQRIGIGWISYSAIWFGVAAWFAAQVTPHVVSLTSSRIVQMEQLLAADRHGFGPLVEMVGSGSFQPAGITDDQGPYLVVPWLSHLIGTQNVDSIIRTCFVLCLSLTAALYPLLIKRLTDSTLAALLSPVIVLAAFRFLTIDGFYWVPAIAIAVSLPWLLVLVRQDAPSVLSCAALAAIAGITEVFRSGTGVGILVALVAICILSSQSWRRKGLAGACIALSFVGVSMGPLSLAYHSRAARMKTYPVNTGGQAGVNNWGDGAGHPFWHTAYIGLGFVSNDYGIRYDDSVAAAYVRSVDPTAPYVSPRYEAVLRRRVFHLIASDPGFVVRAEATKLRTLLADGASKVPLVLVLVPVALLLGFGRRRRWRYSAVLAPLVLFSVAPSLVAVPLPDYELPWFGLLAAIATLTTCWFVGQVEAKARHASVDSRFQPALAPLRAVMVDASRWRAARTSGLNRIWVSARSRVYRWVAPLIRPLARFLRWFGRLFTALGRIAAHPATRAAVRRGLQSRVPYLAAALILAGFLAGRYLQAWHPTQPPAAMSGASTLPWNVSIPNLVADWPATTVNGGWTAEVRTTVLQPRVSQLNVTTSSKNNAYQLTSPILTLPAGAYLTAVRGELTKGGLQIGILGVKRDVWLAESSFATKPKPAPATMPLSFSLTARTRVQVILSNWNTSNRPSSWRLDEVLIARQTGPTSVSSSSPRLSSSDSAATKP